jgi:hypothetical protein
VGALLERLEDIELQTDFDAVPFHAAFTRAPEVVPIRFRAAEKQLASR